MKDSLPTEESYKILVEWARHHNERLSYFNNIHMLIHGVIVTAIGYLVYDKNSYWEFDRNNLLILVLSLFGIILAGFWRAGLLRMRIETDMRFGQLRALERIMGFRLEQQIFTEAYRFFYPKKAGEEVSLDELIALNHEPKDARLGFLGKFEALLVKVNIIKEKSYSLLDVFMKLLLILIFVYFIVILLFLALPLL